MKNSLTDRIRVTRRGKIMRREMGVGHFRTRKSAKVIQHKQKETTLNYPAKKILNY